jgi:undecaprenyl diphosphate synthase
LRFFFNKEKLKNIKLKNESEELEKKLNLDRVPRHVAIIMDGNGRWAQKRGLPRVLGHRSGVESLRDIIKTCVEVGIGALTVYAFSTENWKRPKDEVNMLISLLCEYIEKELNELHRQGVQIRAIGHIEALSATAQRELAKAQSITESNHKLVLNLAINYGGRLEIVDAARTLATLVKAGELELSQINESQFQKYIYTADLPDPDLLIRSAGEHRLSNFLLWQMAYTEFYSTPVLWPDFRRKEFLLALIEYQHRERRFGGL